MCLLTQREYDLRFAGDVGEGLKLCRLSPVEANLPSDTYPQ